MMEINVLNKWVESIFFLNLNQFFFYNFELDLSWMYYLFAINFQ